LSVLQWSATEIRIHELAKRVCDLYTAAELKKLTKVSPQTIRRWAQGWEDKGNRPTESTAMCLPAILAVSENNYQRYLNGDITLDEFWDLKGSAKITAESEITVESVLNDAKRLSTGDLLKLMSNLFLIIVPKELNELQAKPQTESPRWVELNETAKKRLSTLLNLSNLYLEQTYQSIIEAGADKALVEDIANGGFKNSYTEPIYYTLLPFLCHCSKWHGVVPSDANPAQYFDSVEQLETSLNS
jgi:hypothetical protein